MAQLSNYAENALINALLRNIAFTSPTTVWLALFTTATTDAGGGTELVGGDYERQPITFAAPVDGVTTNSAAVSFTGMPGETVTHAAVMDDDAGGNMLLHGPLTDPIDLDVGETLTFAPGDIAADLA